MKKSTVFAVVAAAAIALPAQAQICSGFPASPRGFYFGARADFPTDLDSFGVEAAYNAAGPLGVYGGLDVVSVEDVDDSDANVYRVGASFEIASLGAFIGPSVSACPVVEVNFTDDSDAMAIPIGLGFGGDLGTPGMSIQPYVIPQLVISRFDNLVGDTETETDFGIRGGVMLDLGMFSVGGEVNHLFVEEADPTFGIRVGVGI